MNSNIRQVKRLMVANRGEIAIRVLRAASELRLRTIAIYTFEDRYSLHRYKADEAYQIGAENDPLKPYLDIEEILRIAKANEVDAIHPGYGFLSENVDFARRCREEGIIFVGPDPEVMEQLGDKVSAKKLARSVEVPLIEGSQKDLVDTKVALEEANRIGYPVIIKAASGGGGRGMRVVRDDKILKAEFEEARSEAITAFGDGTIFLEKFIENPKHIEVQLLGDRHGNIVHLFERDCSVQRRFQKVVEVAPCVTLSQKTRDKLYEYALKLGNAVGYNNAGTVEFLVDEDESIYFIEVNPRIQVEHTVTEEVTGVDLVRSQILIAQGYSLRDEHLRIGEQKDVQLFGCAIQCRVTTEDPSNDFKPDYGRIIAYRSASGMGIRLDAGSAFPGAKISPFFDSLLVKVTAWGQDMPGAAQRLHRALREFRIRGLKTNIGFLLHLLNNETFRTGKATVKFIGQHPELLKKRNWRDRGTKMLRYLAEVNINKNPDVKYQDKEVVLLEPKVPDFDPTLPFPKGTKDRLTELGREGFTDWLKAEKAIQYTDTTFRDAHQSLLATRMRTYDMMKVAESYARHHGGDIFSMEVWGGATFDVALRFLKEDPWKRLARLRKAMPNVLLQMLLRGSNAVGYTAYPDNLIIKFVEQAAETGIDVFRIFDSLNWVEAMKTSIRAVNERTNSLAEACISYSGDISDPSKTKFTLDYYLDLAKELEDEGAHILAVKDMSGLLKPYAATELIGRLKETVDIPVHLHTHDTSSIQSTTYLKAMEAGVDVIDVAIAAMSGLTSQPNFNSFVAMMQGQERANDIDLKSLNQFSSYWELTRRYYYAFETELRAGTAEIYDMEIPGGQYSNLRPQARGLGLEDKFDQIKKNYSIANDLLGNIIKVTPSSKVVGDMAMFMTSNNLSQEAILEKGHKLDFPDSVKALMRGDLGQIKGGFPEEIQKIILKGEKSYTDRPNAHLEPIDFDKEYKAFEEEFGDLGINDFLSFKLYPKVYRDYRTHVDEYGEAINLPTQAFFYGLEPNEEIIVPLGPGKNVIVKYLNSTAADESGRRLVFFELNGQTRSILIRDNSSESTVVVNRKASGDKEIGSPLQGNISKILVREGQEIQEDDPLFVIEAMKMESTITTPIAGTVKKIHLPERTLVEQDDLVIELE
ncbi:MAG TPA: pyruvate carboxylase [Saprospiraceae bacterium]|nr:pyruvate carboxylase [Saprospiraceae bacterium]